MMFSGCHRWTRLTGLIFFLLLCLLAPAEAQEQGVVTQVLDGDSLRLEIGHRAVEVRLAGVDAPEHGQAYGNRAKKFTKKLAMGQSVTLIPQDVDQYGRVVAVVILPGDHSLNQELVRAGLAWWNRRFAPLDGELESLEKEARRAKRGLWADPNPMPPWQWRKNAGLNQ